MYKKRLEINVYIYFVCGWMFLKFGQDSQMLCLMQETFSWGPMAVSLTCVLITKKKRFFIFDFSLGTSYQYNIITSNAILSEMIET